MLLKAGKPQKPETAAALIRHLDLFSGIGGFALAARRVGWQTVGFCEIDPYCQKVLRKHWPGVTIYDDVRRYTGTREVADIVTGGFPCQDISHAGKQAGIAGERSGLWSELARILGEIRPRYAVLENVSALLSGDSGRWFQRVLGDLAEIGFSCEWHCIPASAVGAPHQRDRVWIVAYPNESSQPDGPFNGKSRRWELGNVADSDSKRGHRSSAKQWQDWRQIVTRDSFIPNNDNKSTRKPVADADRAGRIKQCRTQSIQAELTSAECRGWWSAEPDVGRVAHGIPRRVDRLRGLGNAIVPQVAEVIFRALQACDPDL